MLLTRSFLFFGDIGVKVPRFCGEDGGPYEGASPSLGGGLILKLESCCRRDVDRSVLLIMATRLTASQFRAESVPPDSTGTTPPLPTPAKLQASRLDRPHNHFLFVLL